MHPETERERENAIISKEMDLQDDPIHHNCVVVNTDNTANPTQVLVLGNK